MTPYTLAGVLSGLVLLMGTCIGVCCIQGIQSPRSFPTVESTKLM